MKLEVLGSGSTGNCYLLHTSCGIIILEAGVRWKDVLIALDFEISNVLCCLVSHEHGDHAKYAHAYMENGMRIDCTHGTLDAIKRPTGNNIASLNKRNIYREDIEIIPFETQHDAVEPCGFYIRDLKTNESLIFATDTYYVKYKFPPVNYIMVECNYAYDILQKNMEEDGVSASRAKRLLTSHFELSRVKDFIKANCSNKLSNVILMHLSSTNGNPKRFKEEIGAITLATVDIAKKGLKIDFGNRYTL